MACFPMLFHALFRKSCKSHKMDQVPWCLACDFGPKSWLFAGNAKLLLTYCISIAFSIEMGPKNCFWHFLLKNANLAGAHLYALPLGYSRFLLSRSSQPPQSVAQVRDFQSRMCVVVHRCQNDCLKFPVSRFRFRPKFFNTFWIQNCQSAEACGFGAAPPGGPFHGWGSKKGPGFTENVLFSQICCFCQKSYNFIAFYSIFMK